MCTLKMMYRCANCDYSSTRRYDLRRHERRKIPCISIKTTNMTSKIDSSDSSESHADSSESHADSSESHADSSESHAGTLHNQIGDRTTTGFVCDKCGKVLMSKYSLKNHKERHCEGVKPNVCPTCLKTFSTRRGRNNHVRIVNCSPQVVPDLQSGSTVVNQTTNNTNVHTTNVHNDHCTVNNNITIKFGEECLEKLIANPDYFKRMEESMRLGKYAIPQHMNDIFFNESFPMNNTIMKSRHNDRFVKIKTGNDQWDTRVVDDVYKSLINKMELYMHPYFSYMEKRMETIYDDDPAKFRRMTRSIREYGHKVLWLDWNCEDIRQIGVDLNDPYCETERQRRIQEMKSLLLEHIYDKTREVLAIE